MNACAFYLGAAFYHLSKRLAGIGFVRLRGHTENLEAGAFRLLGIVSLMNVAATVAYAVYKKTSGASGNGGSNREQIQKGAVGAWECVLCLDALSTPSCCSPCGHVYCWDCIMGGISNAAECPLCKAPVQPTQVVAIANY